MMDDETYIARVKRSRKRFADNLLTADIVDDGDEKPASCHIRKLDALLAIGEHFALERRKLISALTRSMPSATSNPHGCTPSATSEINPETLSELEKAVNFLHS